MADCSFDDFNELGFEQSFAFMRSIGDSFSKAYLPIFQRRQELPFAEQERKFQLYRRGRYVEFNLVYDRGTSVRSANWRAHRIYSDVPTTSGSLGVRLDS